MFMMGGFGAHFIRRTHPDIPTGQGVITLEVRSVDLSNTTAASAGWDIAPPMKVPRALSAVASLLLGPGAGLVVITGGMHDQWFKGFDGPLFSPGTFLFDFYPVIFAFCVQKCEEF